MSRLLIALFLCALAAPALAADDRHVVIITLDGFPAYTLRDPRAPIPTLRKLAHEGVAAEGMRVSNPSVTWPNHTTLATGVPPAQHHVLFNGLLVDRGSGKLLHVDPNHDQSQLIAVPTIWDVAHKAGLTTAAVNWPCSRNSSTLDDNMPDVPNQFAYITPALKSELISSQILPDAKHCEFACMSPPEQDQLWTSAACYLIRHRKPNLLMIHMLVTDTIQHQYGPQTAAAYTALALADYQLRDVLAALDDAGIRDTTTLFITADHGFSRFKKIVQPNVILQQEGLLRHGDVKVQAVTDGGVAILYFSDPSPGLIDQVASLFKGREGIADVIRPDRFAELGLPSPDTCPGMGRLVLAARTSYSFGPGMTGKDCFAMGPFIRMGSHGYLSSNPEMNAIFIACGRGIRKGAKLGIIDNTSVAPTAAALLGQQLPGSTGAALREILDVQPPHAPIALPVAQSLTPQAAGSLQTTN